MPLLNDEERNICCKDGPLDDDPPQGCIDIWREELKKARHAAETALAYTSKAQTAYTEASRWEAQLKSWLEDACKAQGKVEALALALCRFGTLVKQTEGSTGQTVHTVKALLCLVNGIVKGIRRLVFESTSADHPPGQIQELKSAIDCNKRLDEKKKQQALECVKAYETKALEADKAHDEVLRKLLDMLKWAEAVATVIGRGEGDFALRWQIKDLRRRIKGEVTSRDKVRHCVPDNVYTDPPCGGEITQPSSRLLPITPEDCPDGTAPGQGGQGRRGQAGTDTEASDYYAHLKKLYDAALGKTILTKKEFEYAQEKSISALACQARLEESIKAAEAAEAAK